MLTDLLSWDCGAAGGRTGGGQGWETADAAEIQSTKQRILNPHCSLLIVGTWAAIPVPHRFDLVVQEKQKCSHHDTTLCTVHTVEVGVCMACSDHAGEACWSRSQQVSIQHKKKHPQLEYYKQ